MSILQLLMFTAHGFSEGGDVTNFLEHMPLVLVQRFMLNLRQLNPSAHDLSSDAHQVSNFSINFRPASDVLGNIGEPLDHGRSNWSSREDDERDDVGSTMEPPDASDGDEAKFGSSISVEVSLA
ncbi:hypothetical protein PsYK624_154970 [Phanerochaete sordida]|uniref:Uncharacterized protein n=1 Tax=Phanerochaete sordida TaxID=48140 RepID=A0A9P3GPN5_9APHY|nr:hypothetical protein PsYK624_154970 [Phanerochaete sordida]